jgi:hypothetical protein
MATVDEFFNSIQVNSAYQRLDDVLKDPTIFPLNIDEISNSLGNDRENDVLLNIRQPGRIYLQGDGFEHFLGWADEPEKTGAKNLGVIRLYIPSQHMVVTYCTLLDLTKGDIDLFKNIFTDTFSFDNYNIDMENVYKLLKKACKGAGQTDKDQDRDRGE